MWRGSRRSGLRSWSTRRAWRSRSRALVTAVGVQLLDGAVRATFDLAGGEFAEPPLDEDHPRRAGRREVQQEECTVRDVHAMEAPGSSASRATLPRVSEAASGPYSSFGASFCRSRLLVERPVRGPSAAPTTSPPADPGAGLPNSGANRRFVPLRARKRTTRTARG